MPLVANDTKRVKRTMQTKWPKSTTGVYLYFAIDFCLTLCSNTVGLKAYPELRCGMSFKVTYKGLVVECNSIEDVDALASQNLGPGVQTGSSTFSNDAKIGLLWNGLDEPYRKMLRSLGSQKEGSTDGELRHLLGFENNHQLAGVMAGLSKLIKRHGFSKKEVIKRQKNTDGNGKRIYRYSLNENFKERLIEAKLAK